MHRWRYILLVIVALGSYADAREPVSALAPLELMANLAGAPTGVAVAPDGAVLVSDAITGTIARVHSSGAVETIALGLDEPQGVALDANGRLLVVERSGGRVLRLEHDGALTPVAEDLRRPEWIAATADSTIFLTAEGHEVIAIGPDAIHLIADGLDHAAGLAAAPDGLYAVAKHQVLRYSAEGVAAIVPGGLEHGTGIAFDALGALWVTAEEIEGSGEAAKGAIGKQGVGGGLGVFARGLRDPRGLAFGADGSLVVADAATGEVLRFRAPSPPVLAALPAYTSRDWVALSGSTDPAARVDAVMEGVVMTAESTESGAFDIVVPLERDADNAVRVFSTAHRGAGLTSAPTLASVRQDSHPPSLQFRRPDAALVHRGLVTIEVSARDDASGIDRIALAVDGVPLGAGPGATSASWDTRAAGDGWHTLSAVAVDRAGNRASASRAVLVDNTPPETRITRGPAGDLLSASAVFAFAGADNLTPADRLRFAWRLDAGTFVDAAESEVTVDRLTPGDHVLEVRAIDLAGNEDPTPAVARFTVQNGLSVRITEPVAGAALPAGQALVRGVFDARGREVGVTVNGVRAVVDGSTFAALVPMFLETTVLTAVVTAAGGTATFAAPITVGDAASLALVAFPASGLAPVTVSFLVRSVVGLTRIELDADGDGHADAVSTDEQLSFTYTQAGVYMPRIRATDVTGAVTAAQGLVHILDGTSFEAARQGTWTVFREALARGDIDVALAAFVADVRERYEVALSVLAAELPRIAGEMRDLSLVSAEAGVAELATTRMEDGITRLYLIYFVQDADGLWRILSM